MVVFPPCKINIGLQIIDRRPDGFHNLRTIFYPLPFYDVLEIIPAKKTTLSLTGLPVQGDSADNLCMKAYRLLKKDFPKLSGYAIHLHKNIPMGAGLGGGSSDAAFMLRLINRKAGLQLSQKQLLQYASLLGSDCSFFIEDRPCLAEGRGEIIHPVPRPPLEGYYLLLLCPKNIQVNTAKAYSLIQPKLSDIDLSEKIKMPVATWKENIFNDFEAPVFRLYPELQKLKETLYEQGAVYASLSGSGSALYGIFSQPTEPKTFIADNIRVRSYPLHN